MNEARRAPKDKKFRINENTKNTKNTKNRRNNY